MRLGRVLAVAAAVLMEVSAVAGSEAGKEIPFRLTHGFLIVVQGSIGPLKDLSFVVDTGARHTVVDSSVARTLHLQSSGSVQQSGLSGPVAMDQVSLEKIWWGRNQFTDCKVLSFDLSSISAYLGQKIDVLLGLDLLSREDFQIDYAEQKIHFEQHAVPENVVAFELNKPELVVALRLEDHVLDVLLDTGSDSAAVFRNRLPKEDLPPVEAQPGHDLNGDVRFARLTAKHVRLGDVELQGVPVFVIPARPNRQGYDGSFSPSVLHAKRIYFDFERGQFGWDWPKHSKISSQIRMHKPAEKAESR